LDWSVWQCKTYVCPGGVSTVIEVIPNNLVQSYTYSISSPWLINGQSNPITIPDDYVLVSGPSNAPFSGTLTVQANNCIGTSAPSSYVFLRNDGPIPCGDGKGGVRARPFINEIELHPNPVNDFFTLNIGQSPLTNLQIISLNGQIMETIHFLDPNNTHGIHTQKWPAGIYMVHYQIKGKQANPVKAVKQ